jgi:hypothetical protein
VLKGNTDKLESRTEVCLFIGYPKGTKGGLFYSPKDQKVIVSTNARFLEEDYVIDHKPRSRVVLEELRRETSTQASQEDTSQDGVDDISLPSRSGRIVDTHVTGDTHSQGVPRRSGRVVRQPDRFMFLGESFDKVPDEHETDPCNYNEAIQNKDADFEQKAMISEMESMYSNQVWDLVEPPEGVKPV